MIKINFTAFILFVSNFCGAQNYPVYGDQIKVNINGLTFDAMEPFISADEQTLFFNSINSGGNTNLYYATKVDDSTFNFVGLVNGTLDTVPGDHLDAVASLDMNNRFFWVSLRDYPTIFENLMNGDYSAGTVSSLKHTYGDFNIYLPGWLIMDAAISYDGNYLYYVNAWFNSCDFGMPCIAEIGVAEKVNDTTFNKLPNSNGIFQNVNDVDYITYAPQLSADGKELYFTRIEIGTVNSELCVSVRDDINDTFSLPMVIYSNNGFVPEATTVSNDKTKIYYHQKNGFGVHEIFLRYRIGVTGVNNNETKPLSVWPNPANDFICIESVNENVKLNILTMDGKIFPVEQINGTIDVSFLSKGIYFLMLEEEKNYVYIKFFKL